VGSGDGVGPFAGFDAVCAPEFQPHFPGVPAPLPREAAKQFPGMFFSAFLNIHYSLDDVLVDGDRVAIRMTVRGTQQAEFEGFPPSGKDITIGSINLFHDADGKIIEQWVETDSLGMLQQIGAISAPDEAASAHS
jgi:hypothetical protein